eukprot:CAMPEP_0201480316 /NCGR_PEP_ID=MMETSP0151_2-20130828/4811_1 /ASSEMBLY_ACC=CAM_ASM_000257 /TAXON_ID=200890 /ORGANISM="Paramoeba atlantica, Strain 621/1 / CCAP 1560/9" /LENGTH=602 /DNA_ID=CAMNT_0047862129 /DNA_START=37 /DNA_END=1842 /DNA_ORIENTATION=+
MPSKQKHVHKGRKKGRQRIQGQKRKGTSGNAANFITRQQAIKRLQVSLAEFRKLCILHGIYPREPRKSPRGKDKTYFYLKDIHFLAHDPMMNQFRNYGSWKQKMVRAKHKKEKLKLKTLIANKPKYRLDQVVLRRYPTFESALDDLDDALSMIYLFSSISQDSRTKATRIDNCIFLSREWESIVAMTHSLRKVFVSIKGIYYQAQVLGHEVTWMVPHQFSYPPPKDVDMRVMSTFLEFYESLMSFVLFKLYHDHDLPYPQSKLPLRNVFPCSLQFSQSLSSSSTSTPMAITQSDQQIETESRLKSLSEKMEQIVEQEEAADEEEEEEEDEEEDEEEEEEEGEGQEEEGEDSDDEEEQLHPLATLFSSCKILLSREVPLASLEFCIKSCGGEVSWFYDEAHTPPFPEDEATHQIVDRPSQSHVHLSRNYIQPQWVYDSLNAGVLLPVEEYAPGHSLPPHLSPFVNDQQEGYVPDQRKHLDDLISRAKRMDELQGEISEEQTPEEVEVNREKKFQEELERETQGIPFSETKEEDTSMDDAPIETKEEVNPQEEDDNLASIMIPSKKKRRLYQRIQYSEQAKKTKIENLENKKKLAQSKKKARAE